MLSPWYLDCEGPWQRADVRADVIGGDRQSWIGCLPRGCRDENEMVYIGISASTNWATAFSERKRRLSKNKGFPSSSSS